MDLTGRVALVTGAGQGVGEQIALTMSRYGAAVTVNDYVADRAERVAEAIVANGGSAAAIAADVTDYTAVETMVQQASAKFGRVDILVNNAGNAGATNSLDENTPFWKSDPADWTKWIEVNLLGVANSTRAVLPDMITNMYGRIVTVISDAGRVGEADLVMYSGAKAGAGGLVRALAKAVGRYGITSNSISLGAIKTPATARLWESEASAKRVLSRYVIRRPGLPEDVAGLAVFLSSDSASWITGQTYPVNGGYSFSL